MRLDTSQNMHMGQQMKLVPRMIQSMEILQLGQPALEERIEQELANNPTLELVETTDSDQAVAQEIEQEQRDISENERELVVSDQSGSSDTSNESGAQDGQAADDFERLSNISDQYGEDWADNTTEAGSGDSYAQRVARRFAGERDAKMDAMANTAARGASLYDQLVEQWHLLEIESPLLEAGEYLIGFIDADGYLRTERPELMRTLPKQVSPEDVDEALEIIQYELEPAGIGARDLRECLLIQIDDRIRRERRSEIEASLELPRLLVDQHLVDIEANRLPKIAKSLGLDVDAVKRGIGQLRQFSPHPGRLLVDSEPVGITPDANIDYDEETDTYTATLTNSRVPALQIAPDYEDMLKNRQVDAETRKFVGNHVRNGRWLIDAIEQRANTLLRVIGVVVQAQRGYFEEGAGALRPLPMTTVADQLGIHVATVSRAVADKYLQTPRGIVPLRMFFSGGTTNDSGQEMAWGAVQAKLKELIDAENKSKPLSDDALVKELKQHGIEIARRTVAKYRDQMNIPTARQRREY